MESVTFVKTCPSFNSNPRFSTMQSISYAPVFLPPQMGTLRTMSLGESFLGQGTRVQRLSIPILSFPFFSFRILTKRDHIPWLLRGAEQIQEGEFQVLFKRESLCLLKNKEQPKVRGERQRGDESQQVCGGGPGRR